MPNSATSWPNSSVTAVTRAPTVASIAHHTTHEAANTNAPMARMPVICTSKSPPAAMQTASVPQIPANRCAGIAPTTSSTLSRSRSLTPTTTMAPPTPPITTAQ